MNVIGKIKVGGTIYDIAYPVGSIYLSVNRTSPAKLFGGMWEQIKDTFLLACGDTYEAGSKGGEEQHTLTVDEMPSHEHNRIYSTRSGEVVPAYGDHNWDGSTSGVPYSPWCGGGYGATPSIDWIKAGANGGSQSHNNMPPYLAVYMWKRLA